MKPVLFLLVATAAALPRLSVSRLNVPRHVPRPFDTTQELFGFKPDIQVNKLTPPKRQNPDRLLSDKAMAPPTPRKLPLAANPPPGTYQDMLVMPTNIPQITAPRMVLRNFPKPTEVGYLLSGRRPADVKVNPQPSDNQAAVQTHIVNYARKLAQKPKQKRRARRLDVAPYINIGNGVVDVGSHAFSHLSYALMHPEMNDMGPFVPRAGPPPPVRLEIMDPVLNPVRGKHLLPAQVRKMFESEIEFLKKEVDEELAGLTEDSKITADSIQKSFESLRRALSDVQKAKDAHGAGADVFQKSLEQNMEDKIEAIKKMAVQLKQTKEAVERTYAELHSAPTQQESGGNR